ncbi:hypothetical protein K438DRAFT_1988610 [Mycena galopus ATCC 62051]|nr:hypothetical protein K438DRAFT_1988610 [Mycena galopus ATCC 62051]
MPNELIWNALCWHATCPSELPGLVVRIDFGEATTSTVMHLIAPNASVQYAQYIVAAHTRHLTATAQYAHHPDAGALSSRATARVCVMLSPHVTDRDCGVPWALSYLAIRYTIPLSRIMQRALHATRFLEGAKKSKLVDAPRVEERMEAREEIREREGIAAPENRERNDIAAPVVRERDVLLHRKRLPSGECPETRPELPALPLISIRSWTFDVSEKRLSACH